MTGLRADAVRNRKRVLEAARATHAQRGTALCMHEVARKAGVGVGTVYRHFPSRQALIDAIAHPFFERGLANANAVAKTEPQGERFTRFVRGFADELASHGVPGHCMWDAPAARPVRTELRGLVAGFVESGRCAGTLRPDLTAEDAFALLWTVAMLIDATDGQNPEIWRRHVELQLDGLRAGPPGRLEVPPFELDQWDRFVRESAARAGSSD